MEQPCSTSCGWLWAVAEYDINPFEGLPGSILIHGTSKGYTRDGLIAMEEVFKNLENHYAIFNGHEIDMFSHRYHVFNRSLICVTCGLTGSYFAIEKGHGSRIDKWHLNLYAITDTFVEVLMTKDHIIPVSKGGMHSMDNYQTMCMPCNSRKGNGDKQKGSNNVVSCPPGWDFSSRKKSRRSIRVLKRELGIILHSELSRRGL